LSLALTEGRLAVDLIFEKVSELLETELSISISIDPSNDGICFILYQVASKAAEEVL